MVIDDDSCFGLSIKRSLLLNATRKVTRILVYKPQPEVYSLSKRNVDVD